MTRSLVTSYVNPDLDGVASSIVLSTYLASKGISAEPVFSGKLDAETCFVLDLFAVPYPQLLTEDYSFDNIYLVDTHEPKQLSNIIPLDRIVQIIDHHPSGNREAFPNAQLTNEEVGAVATLLTEILQTEMVSLGKELISILYAAILSNTLNFSSPTTTERDHKATAWLSAQTPIPRDLAERMFETRSEFEAIETQELLLNNYKQFDCSGMRVGIVQVEGIGVKKLLLRRDLELGLSMLQQETDTSFAFLSFVDIGIQKTFIIADREEIRKILSETLGAKFDRNVAVFDRILLRKSDLVPALNRFWSQLDRL